MNHRIESVSDYIDIVTREQKNILKEGSYVNNFLLFRGQGDSYPLIPSIARNRNNNNLIFNEKAIIDSMQRLKPEIFKKEYSAVDTLALLQLILSRLVDTFFSRISPTMQLPPKHHSIAYVLPWAEGLHWQSRSSGCSNS